MKRQRELLDELFYNPQTGFVGEEKLYKRAKLRDASVTRKQVKEYLQGNEIHQVFQKSQYKTSVPKIHGKVGHYQADLTFLTSIKKQNSNYHILLNVINVNTKFVYSESLKDKQQNTVLEALERIRMRALNDGRPLKILQTDNGKEFTNNKMFEWMRDNRIISQFCEKDDKKCLGVAERFNRTIKLMIEKYLTSKNSNRWIDSLEDFIDNYNSSYHSSIKGIPERLEMFDEVDLIRTAIKHNKELPKISLKKGDFVRILNKRGTFEKEGQRFTGRIYVIENIGLNSVTVVGRDNKIALSDILKIPASSKDIGDSLRQQHLRLYRADKRIREREGISPDRSPRKRTRRS